MEVKVHKLIKRGFHIPPYMSLLNFINIWNDSHTHTTYTMAMTCSSLHTTSELTFCRAEVPDTSAIFALYRSLVGSPYCAWTSDYPAVAHVHEDIEHQALYVVRDGISIIAAGTIDHLEEHDPLQNWYGKNPCDLLRFGVARAYQGQGVGMFFLNALSDEAYKKNHDALRILVSITNFPAVALYRKIGAMYHGDTVAYAIHWHCFERLLGTAQSGINAHSTVIDPSKTM